VAGCTLRPGRYWLVAQIAQGDGPGDPGIWGWDVTEHRQGYNDAWRDLNGSYASWCKEWDTLDNCWAWHYDYVFKING
jgi:hypothetical protein